MKNLTLQVHLKQKPEFELLLNVDKTFVSKFISGKGALPDTESFTIVSGDNPEVVIGYSSIATNRVAVPVENQTDNQDADNARYGGYKRNRKKLKRKKQIYG